MVSLGTEGSESMLYPDLCNAALSFLEEPREADVAWRWAGWLSMRSFVYDLVDQDAIRLEALLCSCSVVTEAHGSEFRV